MMKPGKKCMCMQFNLSHTDTRTIYRLVGDIVDMMINLEDEKTSWIDNYTWVDNEGLAQTVFTKPPFNNEHLTPMMDMYDKFFKEYMITDLR